MKSEQEIRKHRDDLRSLRVRPVPCDCAAAGHAEGCHQGSMIMVGIEMTLSWLLDENPDHDKVVENMAGFARQPR